MYFNAVLDQERIEQSDAAQYEWQSMGEADAACGTLPQYINTAYLTGYFNSLRELPQDATGRLIYPGGASNSNLADNEF